MVVRIKICFEVLDLKGRFARPASSVGVIILIQIPAVKRAIWDGMLLGYDFVYWSTGGTWS